MEKTLIQRITTPGEMGFLILVISGILGIAAIADFLKPESLEKKCIASVNQAVAKSAGEDRIWSINEKRKFLDKYGFHNTIISKGQDIYFRVNGEKIDVIAGYNLENNGGFLGGSDANSGTKIGEISYEKLENYQKQD